MHASDQTTKNETGGRERIAHTRNIMGAKAQSISLSPSLSPLPKICPQSALRRRQKWLLLFHPQFFWVGPDRKLISAQSEKEEEEEEGAANDGARRGIRGAQETSRKWVGAREAVLICSHIVECSIGLNFSSTYTQKYSLKPPTKLWKLTFFQRK